MKCYICILHGAEIETLMDDKNWPPDAITTVGGTAVCAEHVSHVANHQVLSARGIDSLPTTG